MRLQAVILLVAGLVATGLSVSVVHASNPRASDELGYAFHPSDRISLKDHIS